MADLELELRRLEILRILNEDAGYRKNLRLIQRILELRGLTVSGDRLAADLAWLAEMGLAETDAQSGILVARLTERGADVCRGRTRVPGVARPGPGG